MEYFIELKKNKHERIKDISKQGTLLIFWEYEHGRRAFFAKFSFGGALFGRLI